MRIAIFGKQFSDLFKDSCFSLFKKLRARQAEIIIYKPFYDFLFQKFDIAAFDFKIFETRKELKGTDFVLSIGGDGTILQAITLVRDSNIPIVGINSGRLGFLADIAEDDINNAVDHIFNGNYRINEVELLQLNTDNNLFGDLNFALNELAVHKRDTASMITVHTFLDGQFLNSYWADGLIVSTSVGSTGYSLSVGGPIIHPKSQSHVITPIAPHNLTVRPMVVPNHLNITLKVEGRADTYLASLDSRSEIFDNSLELNIQKAPFSIKMIDLPGINYYATLRNKLMWGADKRNY
ncbi:NAD kinase [Plebeiibacterium marinum]|uniref:NAD kinase n=1 Tax=Plebeiibacterium marinum TaxID=2992111 RepID=A0AAE3MG63_9BACT|nr:NAD kinase [Plebeiobacterium marinum]MCW3807154.1 NAD kinase [Plebeiobacterium marinum]